MFNSLTQGLTSALQKVFSQKLTDGNITDALTEVKTALLAADVHFKVAREIVENVRTQCVGQKVLESVQPGQQVVKIVHDELVRVLGNTAVELPTEANPLKILLCGLQGSGKTTAASKLALLLKKTHTVTVVACDLARPAAIEQLRVLATQVGVNFFTLPGATDPVLVAQAALATCKDSTAFIFDTAGRLQIDAALMTELASIHVSVAAQESFLVVDSALGQQAVAVAQGFAGTVPLTGLILTKLDGDARGGAALSIRTLTGLPIRYMSTGEKPQDFELFHPDRLAGRILGMGDVVSLVEKAQATFDQKEATDMAQKAMSDDFNLEDLLKQFQQMSKMGDMGKLLQMIPGMSGVQVGTQEQRKMKRSEAIILAMTPQERRQPSLIAGSRLNRIAKGTGVPLKDVNALLKQFHQMRDMMKMMKGSKGRTMMKQMAAAQQQGK